MLVLECIVLVLTIYYDCTLSYDEQWCQTIVLLDKVDYENKMQIG